MCKGERQKKNEKERGKENQEERKGGKRKVKWMYKGGRAKKRGKKGKEKGRK